MELLERRKSFGKWLRACRKQARMTQSELAELLGYDSSQLISNIERGVSLLPSKRIPEFAKAVGCSLLEMEVRYFQCSARNTSESRMPDLLLKYLPLIEVLEFGRGTAEEITSAIQRTRALNASSANLTHVPNEPSERADADSQNDAETRPETRPDIRSETRPDTGEDKISKGATAGETNRGDLPAAVAASTKNSAAVCFSK